MILHQIESPNIAKSNTLTKDIRGLEERDRYDCILANPPFGGKEKEQIQQNFPTKSNATELLFLQHIMNSLRLNGKCGVVVPEGILFQLDAFARVKEDLLQRFNLHTILSLPAGLFLPYSGVKTNVLFFDRVGSTEQIYYYEVKPPHKLTKKKPITYEHFADFLQNWQEQKETENSWRVDIQSIIKATQDKAKPYEQKAHTHKQQADKLKRRLKALAKDDTKAKTKLKEEIATQEALQKQNEQEAKAILMSAYDLSAKNPNTTTTIAHKSPTELIKSIQEHNHAINVLMDEVQAILLEGKQ